MQATAGSVAGGRPSYHSNCGRWKWGGFFPTFRALKVTSQVVTTQGAESAVYDCLVVVVVVVVVVVRLHARRRTVTL